MSQEAFDQIRELSDHLTDEERAILAGELLEEASVDRDTFEKFNLQLNAHNREELWNRLDLIVNPDNQP